MQGRIMNVGWLAFALFLAPFARSGAEDHAIRITPRAVFAHYVEGVGGEDAVRRLHTAHFKLELYVASTSIPSAWIDRFDDESGKLRWGSVICPICLHGC